CDIKVFSCPKLGNSLEEYEDAWAHRQTRTPLGIRVAVADGATESSFAKLWAVLLAESYVRSELAGEEFFARLKPARRLWQRRLAGRPLPWFASAKAEQGAFAAFLGVEIDAHTNRWTALAVGDCCLMHVDDVGKGMRDRNVSLAASFAIHDEPVSDRLPVGRRITAGSHPRQQGQPPRWRHAAARHGCDGRLAAETAGRGATIMEVAVPEARHA